MYAPWHKKALRLASTPTLADTEFAVGWVEPQRNPKMLSHIQKRMLLGIKSTPPCLRLNT
ncbi:hypothetical protein B1F84_11590 [Pseudoalteromonas sp. DL-6]|nr:hypothetical protein B1F84_11590 [Pseudoalteromonas sp. DL-6]